MAEQPPPSPQDPEVVWKEGLKALMSPKAKGSRWEGNARLGRHSLLLGRHYEHYEDIREFAPGVTPPGPFPSEFPPRQQVPPEQLPPVE